MNWPLGTICLVPISVKPWSRRPSLLGVQLHSPDVNFRGFLKLCPKRFQFTKLSDPIHRYFCSEYNPAIYPLTWLCLLWPILQYLFHGHVANLDTLKISPVRKSTDDILINKLCNYNQDKTVGYWFDWWSRVKIFRITTSILSIDAIKWPIL